MDVDSTAAYLQHLRTTGERIDTLAAALTPPDLASAYAAQRALVARLCAQHGGAPCGYKVALTSTVAQSLIGVGHPVYGHLVDSHVHASGARIEAARHGTRIVEVEFGFAVAVEAGPAQAPYSADSIAAHLGALYPSIEIVDHHYGGLDRMSAATLVADNAIHGCWVHGDPVHEWQHLDLARWPTRLLVDGDQRLTGAGDRTLGGPLHAVAWLANALLEHGERLRAGDRVTSGLTTDGIHEAVAGEQLQADFGRLGEVSLSFE